MQVVSKEPRGRIVKESKDHQAKSPVLGSFCIVVRKTTNRRVPKKKNWVRLLPGQTRFCGACLEVSIMITGFCQRTGWFSFAIAWGWGMQTLELVSNRLPLGVIASRLGIVNCIVMSAAF